MNHRDPLYRPQALLLVAAVSPLALAEGIWWYWVVMVVGVALGWLTTVHYDRPLLGRLGDKMLVLAALGVLLVEYFFGAPLAPVLLLSHFFVIVATGKLLHRRSVRDHGQLLVLSLLLLMVAAIVSSNLVFPMALSVYLTVGLSTLIRRQLQSEAARIEAHQRQIHPPVAAGQDAGEESAGPATMGPAVMVAAISLLLGVMLFVSFPRMSVGMLGQFSRISAAPAITGFSEGLDLRTTGAIRESDRTVMRVRIERDDGTPVETGGPFYYRGAVLDQYVWQRTGLRFRRQWGWRGAPRDTPGWRTHTLQPSEDLGNVSSLLATERAAADVLCLVQKYYLEAPAGEHLFTCFPPIEIRSYELDEVRKHVPDQILVCERKSGGSLHYTIRSPAAMESSMVAALAEERVAGAEPEVLPPNPPLPDEQKILALIERQAGGIGPLDQPANRLALVRRLVDYLHSQAFTYTLAPPPPPADAEPIGHFLLTTHSGHCEYFASALAIMCQLKGIQARVVTGYHTGEYNPVGRFYLVQAKHAHAWVEAFIPGRDWVTFDPTPAGVARGHPPQRWVLQLRCYADYLHFYWANLVVSYDADLRRELFASFQAWLRRPAQDQETGIGALGAFVRELFGWRLQLTWRERLIYWVFTLLVVALVVLSGYLVARMLRWSLRKLAPFLPRHGSAERRGPEVEFYTRYCRQLAAWELHRREDQTPAEFAEELAAQSPVFGHAPDLVRAYYEVAFGQHPLPASRLTRIEAFLNRLRKAKDSAAPGTS